jgi:hypothetical protein
MLCSNIPNFSYLICEGERNFYREDYTMEDMKEIQSKIESKINNFIFFLRNANLFGDYEKYWDRKYK